MPAQITVSGAPEGFDARLVLKEAEAGPVCHVARDDKRLAAMRDALRFYAPDVTGSSPISRLLWPRY